MNRSRLLLLLGVLLAALCTATVHGQERVKYSNLKDGLEAAKKSGRALVVITRWKGGVCSSCDTWSDRVPAFGDVAKQLARFEVVEWFYDGLGGKVIAWTRAHGGTSDDPSVQVFVVSPDSGAVARARTPDCYAPEQLAAWLKNQGDAWERARTATRVPFEPAVVKDGACAPLDLARKAGRPTLLYVARGDRDDADKNAKAQALASRKFEKTTLDSEAAEKACEDWVLLRLDIAEADQAALAKALGVEKAPTLLLFVPGEDKPQDLGSALDGAALASKLKKSKR